MVFLLLSTQYVKVSANNEDDSEYDDGIELQDIEEPEVENHEPTLVHTNMEQPKKKENLIPKETLKAVKKQSSLTSNVGAYIPLGIIAFVALNIVAISIVMMMKRKRAQVVYSKMNVAKNEAAFELKETES